MDSITQIALGAAVAQASIGRRAGRRAALWGAALGTVPDLDVLVRFADPVSDFTYHRGVTHSLVVLTLAAPLLAWLIHRLGRPPASYRDWLLATWLVLVSHPVLDAFTIYGTQLFWPFSAYPVGWGSIFIIDPLYTLPLAIGAAWAAIEGPGSRRGGRANRIGLALSGAYLAWTLAAQATVERLAERTFAERGIEVERVLVLAAPFNTAAWRVVAMRERDYLVGWYSWLHPDRPLELRRYPSRPEALGGIEDTWAVRRLEWFTKGFRAVEVDADGAVAITDLRMGVEPDRYAFSFEVGRVGAGITEPVAPRRRLPSRLRRGDLARIWAVAARGESIDPCRDDCLLSPAGER